jgi:hypothetical protein
MAEESTDDLRSRWATPRRAAPWIALVVAKLWLVDGQRLTVYGSLTIDDQWFVARAASISAGQWMGPFDAHTLIKQPGYPMFIAAMHALHLPLLLAHQLLYVMAVALVLVALRPVLPHRGRRMTAFALLLFNPMTMNTPISARVDRSGIYPALTMLLLASLVGLVGSCGRPRRLTVVWAVASSASLAALWLVREEWLLVLPAVVVGLGLAILRVARSSLAKPRKLVAAIGIAATPLSVMIGTLWLQRVNDDHYGLAVTNIEQTSVSTGLGAMFRVEPVTDFAQFPVTRETRALLYANSSHFAELRGPIEAAIGGRYASVRPDGVRDLGGQVFQWVLLDAVGSTGHASTAVELDATLRAVGAEINSACDDGELRCSGPNSGIAPGWQWSQLPAVTARSVTALRKTFDLGAFSALSPDGDGTTSERALFATMTDEELAPASSGFLTRQRVHLIAAIRWVYRLLIVAVVVVGIARLAKAIRRRRAPLWTAATTGVVGLLLVGVRAGGLAYLDVAAFPAFSPSYLASGYATGLVMAAVAILGQRPAIDLAEGFVTT